jgi:DNA-directed RNA polymerase specialized sigma24 family protein
MALKSALAALSDEERVLLRLRFEQNLTVREISQLRGADPKVLYRRYERILRQLRASMEGRHATIRSGHRATDLTIPQSHDPFG